MHYLFFSVFILGLNFWKKRSAFSGNVWEKLWLSTPKQSWDQWTQSNMQMEHKSPDGPLSSMQNIGGKWDQWSQVACPSMITMQYAICQDVLRRDDMICESPTWTTSEVSGLKFEKKNAFSVNVWQNYEFPSKNAGNWGILCWDQWSQRNMPICVEKDWYNLHMERKSPDGPPLSMQNIDGKLFWISSLASLVDPSFWSRERVCYQIFGPVWSCLHEWPEFEMILDRMSLTSPGPKL